MAEDDAYILSNMQKAIEPVLPTEENPVGSPRRCPVHSGMYYDPEMYPDIMDPNSPYYDPSGGFGDAGLGIPVWPGSPITPENPEDPNAEAPVPPVQPGTSPVQPETPVVPEMPVEPDPNEDWFADLWQDPA